MILFEICVDDHLNTEDMIKSKTSLTKITSALVLRENIQSFIK